MNAVLVLALLAPAADPVPAPDVRDNVARGLQWLCSQQKADGSWEAPNILPQTVVTARAGLALLMEGSTTSTGKYAPNLRKAAAWLAAQAQPDGRLVADKPLNAQTLTLSHAQALLFLVSVYDTEADAVRAKAQAALIAKAVTFALDRRTPNGGWSQVVNPVNSDDNQSTCEMLHALLVARKSGAAVPRAAIDTAVRLLEGSTTNDGGVAFARGNVVRRPVGSGSPDISASASALALTGGDVRREQVPGWVRHARRGLSNYERTLTQRNYFVMQQAFAFARVAYALGEAGHDRLDAADESVQVMWSRERAKLFKALTGGQKPDGSWPDEFGAPVYTTALALTVLQLDNGYLPAFTR